MFINIRAAAAMTAAVMSALVASSAAVAAPDENSRSAVVSYNDLDLTADAGVARLNQRVRVALNRVCDTADTRDLAARAQVIACRKAAMDKANATVRLAVAAARSDTRLAQASAPAIRVGAR